MRGRRTPPETRAAVVADYAAGLSSTQVGQKYGVSASSVVAWARAAGVEIKKPGKPDQEPEAVGYKGRWMLIGGIRRPTHPAPRAVPALPAADSSLLERRSA